MGFLDSVRNKSSIDASSSGSADTFSPTASQPVPGAGTPNDIQSINGNRVDVAFLDALYGGGKVTALQREAILTGSDPSSVGLNQYDLWYLTVGRLGSRVSMSTLGMITAWAATATYTAGQIVQATEAGNTSPSLFQAQAAVPANTPLTNASYWVKITGPGASAGIAAYDPTVSYPAGQFVYYTQPQGTVAVYRAQAQTQAGALPSAGNAWVPVSNPGPVVLSESDILNPAFPALAAVTSSISSQTTAGPALQSFLVPVGRRYRVTASVPRPVTPGGSTPADSTVTVSCSISEQTGTDVNGNPTAGVVVTPRWTQIGPAINSAVGAVGAGVLSARLRIELL